jgi:serine/threonine protein kinase
MSDHSPPPGPSSSPSGEDPKDRVCKEFEAAWKAGERPHIADYLDQAPELDRPALLPQLVLLEVDYRRRAGEQPSREEYLARFPEYAELLGALFSELGSTDTVARPPEVSEGLPTTGPFSGGSSRDGGSDVTTVPPDDSPFGTAPSLPVIPGYEILEPLSRGGMGVVYKARQLNLDRLVVLKMIRRPELVGEHGLVRFRQEATAIAQLIHPNIVQIYDFGERDGLPYFIMEFMEGGSLDRRLAGKPLPPHQAAQLVEVLARTMHFVHQRQIIHRDLKPANILLTADGTPKIADFGLVKRLDRSPVLTGSRVVLGTASYMAPEQAEGKTKEVKAAADIYALGAILYELLTGRPPFRGETPELTIFQVLADEPVPPSHLQPDVPREVEAICLKCLEKKPEERYADGAALALDLRRFLAGETPSIKVLSEWEWRERWARRAGFELLDVLTWGVWDVVYKAWHIHLKRLVGLKVIATLAQPSPEELARFRGQAEVIAQLSHPNIVTVYHVGEQNGWAYFSMEFVEGGNLIEKFKDNSVPPVRAAELVATLARAMSYAHQKGIIHGALKPSNILLTEQGIPKITNFGLSILLEKEQELSFRKRVLRRLPSYLAPELAEGRLQEVGPASDVYALGAILYKLLTGGPPFLGETLQETLEHVGSRDPLPPSQLQPEVPRTLERICLQCLQKQPQQRPASAEKLADDLQRFLVRQEPETDEFELVPGYEILEELGRGGLGTVYRACQKCFNRLVALKIFDPLPPERLTRIRAANAALANLEHPNILKVYDSGVRDGVYYVAEELVEGISLEKKTGHQSQAPREAAQLVEKLAGVMHDVHQRRIVHCNLKPQVVLLTANGVPKISSFELARLLDQDTFEEEGFVGTPSYVTPEQARPDTRTIGPYTDIYALGNILYQLLTAQLPFQNENFLELLDQVRSQPPLAPSKRRPEVDLDLDAICLKCLQKEPAQRYPSALALAQDLRRFLEGRPVEARPIRLGERLRKWFRRSWRNTDP